MNVNISELAERLRPFFIDLVEGVQISGSPSPHDLDSVHHSGSLSDSQAPQFLKTDGTRQLVGNLSVADAITVDGVDVSAHAAAVDAHHNKVHAIDGADHSGTLAHTALSSVTADQHHAKQHVITASADHTVTGAAMDLVGLTGANTLGILTPSDAPGANSKILKTGSSGELQINHLTASVKLYLLDKIQGHMIPDLADTYDIGSSTLLWRKGYLSEIDAVIFAQQTITLLGGWLIVGKNEGKVYSAVGSGDTVVDFGQPMTVGHFVLFRAALQVEYMQVGTLVVGNVYNVTRNLDGSGANNWPDGSVYLVLGTTGDGRIELNSYDTPRIQIVEQGATYNAQTERIRIGDLNGNWGYATQIFGAAFGEYASNKPNITIDPTNGLRIRNYSTDVIKLDVSGNASIEGVLNLGSGGGIYQGTGTFASPTTGLKMWNDGGYGRIAGYSSSVLQWYGATDGKLYAGAGDVKIDADGITIAAPVAVAGQNSIKWQLSAKTRAYLEVTELITPSKVGMLQVGTRVGWGSGTKTSTLTLSSENVDSAGASVSRVYLEAYSQNGSPDDNRLNISGNAAVAAHLYGGLVVDDSASGTNSTETGVVRAKSFTSGWLPFGNYGSLGYGISSSGSIPYAASLPYSSCTLRYFKVLVYVATTNSGSHYWIIALKKGADGSTIASVNTSAISADSWALLEDEGLSVSLNEATLSAYVEVVKSGSPGNINVMGPAAYVQ